MRLFSRLFLLSSFAYAFLVVGYILLGHQSPVIAETNHIVISQIQISGTSGANDEFVELYNPTDTVIDITGWRLNRKTSSSGATPQNLVASLSGSIQARKYFLIAHPSATFAGFADRVYSSSSSAITTNNTISLFSDAGVTLVDKVGLGTAADVEATAFVTNPSNNQSIIRKSSASSTETSLILGGSEYIYGNGYDTDNNANDFVLMAVSQPRNALSSAALPTPTTFIFSTPLPTETPAVTPEASLTPTEPITPTSLPTPLPTNTPLPTLQPTNTPMPTAVPTPQPTNTPIPTATPTPLPTNTPVPTHTPTPFPTNTPTPFPTVTPIPITTPIPLPTPTLIVMPTQLPTPTPQHEEKHIIVNEILSTHKRLVCTQSRRQITLFTFHFYIPVIRCEIIRS